MRIIIIFIVTIISFCSLFAQEYSIMSYNIRYDNPDDGDNKWDLRNHEIVKLIKFYNPDILGIQEGLKHQVEYLDVNLEKYNYYGIGRDDGKENSEFSAIFYKKDAYEILDSSTFWLSETPTITSTGWDAALPRICSYVYLKEKVNNSNILILNTHFDHLGDTARINSAKLIIEKIQKLNSENNFPVILMGDFNSTPDEKPIELLSNYLNDSGKSSAKISFGPEGTFNAFDYMQIPEKRIDYIFYNNKILITCYGVLNNSSDQKFPSDHFPVYIKITIK